MFALLALTVLASENQDGFVGVHHPPRPKGLWYDIFNPCESSPISLSSRRSAPVACSCCWSRCAFDSWLRGLLLTQMCRAASGGSPLGPVLVWPPRGHEVQLR